jgi:hypothetical protein
MLVKYFGCNVTFDFDMPGPAWPEGYTGMMPIYSTMLAQYTQ